MYLDDTIIYIIIQCIQVRMLLIAMKNHETDIKKSDNDEKTIAIYDVLLKDVIEAQNSLKDELIKEDVVSL